ncbi:MAG: VWA domain-containing protein [bacterium]|nr:VWA domain-containing protein [bacterium]
MRAFVSALMGVILVSSPVWAASVRLSQIDNGDLLLKQQVKLYLSLTDDEGEPLQGVQADRLKVYEGVDEAELNPMPITGFRQASTYEEGVRFYLLVDNSGSMYRNLEGQATAQEEARRISIAKLGVQTFLNSVSNPKDRIGLALYNSYYQQLSAPTDDRRGLVELLGDIEKPTGDAVYTELYGSLIQATGDFGAYRGRRAMIILSDGENSPLKQNTGKDHPVFGDQKVPWHQALESLQREGISLYTISFGPQGGEGDKQLREISVRSGGAVFDAHNETELKAVYRKILRQILGEYSLTYRAGMEMAQQKYVRVTFEDGDRRSGTTRFYYSGGLLAEEKENIWPIAVGVALASLLLFWLLSKVKFERNYPKPHLEILDDGGAQISTQVLDLGQGQTIIGGAADAGLTIAGGAPVADHHATIMYDAKTQAYTLVADGMLTVNNQSVQTKVLESGDVIKVGNTTMIFDDPKEK